MKSFLHSSFFIFHFSFALAFACLHANAEPSYWAAIHTDKYDSDKSAGSEASKAAYSGYYCTVATAASLFGGTTESAISSYFLKDYDTYMAAKDFASTKSGVTAFDSVAFTDGEYELLDYVGSGFTSSEYIALAFYSSGDVNGFRVFDASDVTRTPYDQLVFAAGSGSSSVWQDAPEQSVPEPSSGLLLFIGLAGIALKRKRIKA